MNALDDFSVDLETLGTRYNAPVIAIGVAQFDRTTGKIGATFYRAIDLDSAIKAGKVSGGTVAWWMTKSPAAKAVFTEENRVSLATALDELGTWMRGLAISPKVWGNGSGFDITILEHAYDNGCVGLREPWHFTNIRDMRTIADVAILSSEEWPKREGTHHNALDDAKHQAACISACYRKLRGIKDKPAAAQKTSKVVTDDEEL